MLQDRNALFERTLSTQLAQFQPSSSASVRVVLLNGELDEYHSLDGAYELAAVLTTRGASSTIVTVPGATHGDLSPRESCVPQQGGSSFTKLGASHARRVVVNATMDRENAISRPTKTKPRRELSLAATSLPVAPPLPRLPRPPRQCSHPPAQAV